MSFHNPHRQSYGADRSTTRPSPLRQTSIASTNSSAYSNSSNPFPPSRTSTISSAASSGYRNSVLGLKRGSGDDYHTSSLNSTETHQSADYMEGAGTYKSVRRSLRPLPQAPGNSPPPSIGKGSHTHTSRGSLDLSIFSQYDGDHTNFQPNPRSSARPSSVVLSRTDADAPHILPHSQSYNPSLMSTPDLATLQKSSTSHLRNLSKLAQSGGEDFSIASPGAEVVGLHGRRRLQRIDSVRGSKGGSRVGSGSVSAWAERNWMDKQRQFLQAYEYLCHIGEAKEWIEDVIQKPIPPIVQLEEALRDGVTLAEIVQAIHPERPFRIFQHPKLQFRHSDNIALFFRFLAEVELPELFRFELIDLYEKKNIPKVIYCIHALSWLLYRKGMVDFRIGNLVGQLEFEHHELEEVQKGLDRAGVAMPSFSGMSANFGAEPEPEPQESEEDRIDRELKENEGNLVELQAQSRAALLRLRLGDTMAKLWDSEDALVELQSRIRGDWARQIVQYRLDMKRFATRLQSTTRGFLVRRRQNDRSEIWKAHEKDVRLLQNIVRGKKARQGVQTLKAHLKKETTELAKLQAAIRGALQRNKICEEMEAAQTAESELEHLQAEIKGMLQRRRLEDIKSHLFTQQTGITKLKAAIRGNITRRHIGHLQDSLRGFSASWEYLQAAIRGVLLRKSIEMMWRGLKQHDTSFKNMQAWPRGASTRQRVQKIRFDLNQQTPSVLRFQTAVRGFLLRKKYQSDLKALYSQTSSITRLQAASRGALTRRQHVALLKELGLHAKEICLLQGLSRAMQVRLDVGSLLEELDSHTEACIDLQSAIRGYLVRRRFEEKKRFFKANMEKVIKVQSFVRARLQGEAYKSLTSGKNPPVGTIKGFVHLLNDNDFDFDEEIEVERLRKTVVQQVRQNEMAEQYIDQLDIKIALLVKNKITLDEVVKHQKHFGGHVGSLLTNTEISSKDPFDLKAINKTSRKKLELYQQLFFILQTQPQYLARLFRKIREQGTAEKDCKRVENLMMGLFGYAQKRREEYYLLKLIARSIKEEIDGIETLEDYMRGNFFWNKLLNTFVRSPRDRRYLRDLLGPLIREQVIENPELDLESDPMQIYRSAINNEELRTGQRSQRRPDIAREEAIRDPETRETFIHHLQDLRDISDQFLAALEELLPKMPFGIRFIAQQIQACLLARFPYEDQRYVLQIVANTIWKCYLHPALTQPETWGVVDRGLTPMQKRNLGEVGKLVGQVATGRLFGGDNVYLQPLNSYVTEAVERLGEIMSDLITVQDAETQFDIDEFNDLYARTKPTLYIKLVDIFAIHQLIQTEIAYLCPSQDDVLREVVHELGSAKHNENEMMGVSTSEICLALQPKLHDLEDPNAEVNALFMETKRCILYIIRVQSGSNLLEIMVKPITMEDEDRWNALVSEEFAEGDKRREAYSEANTMIDIRAISYTELKRTALENILRLEQTGRVTRQNHYQDLLNAIAVDIRTKHRRRIQRQRELEGVKLTLNNLNQKATWLDQQLKSYNDYIEQAMVTLQNKKGKKRFLLPFTKQYNHERELERSGRKPKFGSYKYSARTLAEKGVLVSYQGYSERQWDKINLTISSDEVGVFFIEAGMGSIQIPGASAQIPLDDLLQAQFNNHQFMNLFEGQLRLNVNLFLHLLFRKFYRDE